jgi:hypothetical protein
MIGRTGRTARGVNGKARWGRAERARKAIQRTCSGGLIPVGQGRCLCSATEHKTMFKITSPDTSAQPTKDSPTCPERDTRKGAQDDCSTDDSNNPPNHRVPTHSVARFLWECDPETPVDELGERYRRWRNDGEQSDVTHWGDSQ